MSCNEDLVTVCTCCEGTRLSTPVEIFNRPGLSALAWRVGTHGRFKASMLAGISAREALAALTTRLDDDLSIALVDGWAVVLDVLTFYQERIANEGFLRTADERLSLLELARTIGYELGPGVSASTWLAFTLDDSPGSPRQVVVPAGTRAQSVPGQDELPQPFETGEEVVGRAAWNALRPPLTEPQLIAEPIHTLYLEGTDTQLGPGDLLLATGLVDPGTSDSTEELLEVTAAEPDAENDRTEVKVVPVAASGPRPAPITMGAPPLFPAPLEVPQPLTADAVLSLVVSRYRWKAEDLQALVEVQGWSMDELAEHLEAFLPYGSTSTLGIHALRLQTSLFGHNAPAWASLPASQRFGEWTYVDENTFEFVPGLYADRDWDDSESPHPADQDSKGTSYRSLFGEAHDVILLESRFPKVVPGGWLVLAGSGQAPEAFRVLDSEDISRADFGFSAKVTRLTLDSAGGLSGFAMRSAAVYGQSEELTLAERPVLKEVKGTKLELDRVNLHLGPGQIVVVTGERTDLEGVVESEVMELAEVVHDLETGATELTFRESLEHRYKRDTVTINANVAPATHGETRREVLGSGNAAQPFQRFALRQKPLTYVSAPVPSGGVSTLELRVNDILWHEAPDFYRLGPGERRYVLRRDDDGTTQVLFGDGVHGARLPSGVENVRAVYRTGTGLAGILGADRLTLLATQPLGVRGVTHPVPASGAEDPETRDQARRNAPFTVKTLDRIVSLRDFEDFARAFSGIGKARADWLWDGKKRVVHVTLAAANGDPVDEDSDLFDDLRDAMDGARDPFQPLLMSSYRRRLFTVAARIEIDPDYLDEVVLGEVEAALKTAFSFDARQFGQSVAASEVVTAMQEVEGVVAVDLEALHFNPQGVAEPDLSSRLDALLASLGTTAGVPAIFGAELLSLAPGPVDLEAIP